MSIIVTGGTGFVGLALAEALGKSGKDCVLFGRTPIPARFEDDFPAAVSVIGDICNSEHVDMLFDETPLESVVHLAAVTPDTQAEMTDPAGIIGVNVGGIANVMRSLSRFACRPRLVLVSSVAVYGNDKSSAEIFSEDDATLKPVSLYGITKLAAENAALRLAELYGIDLRIVRLGPLFGPWEYSTGLRPVLSPHAQVLEVWKNGTDAILPRPLVADWLYSRDAARGLAAILNADRLLHSSYNLGGGVLTSVADWCAGLQSSPFARGWRVAQSGEEPNIQFGLARDRAALGMQRITAETDFRILYTGSRVIEDYLAWMTATTA
ncbi:NAD(P)-dependent oxidoreductase [Phyllobacterium sp. SB3]|uniref:NAD-dependent epimerase/dehydratase family protein n=1 Tax=Phyllobacterium sp. SB3 TaxID=3156073 RepID=UPI0032AF264F